MVAFEVTSAKECTINGLGAFEAGETKRLKIEDLIQFESLQGYPISEANFPTWVELVVVSGKEV